MTAEVEAYPIEVLTTTVQRSIRYVRASSAREAEVLANGVLSERPELTDGDEVISYNVVPQAVFGDEPERCGEDRIWLDGSDR